MRLLIYVIPIALTLYSFFDVARTPQEEVRRLPKWAWLLLVLLLFYGALGAIAWLALGRPKREPGARPGRGKIIPPDDDPDFLRKL
jgi:energy-coupling factor transporter transmembrane protein EcfT